MTTVASKSIYDIIADNVKRYKSLPSEQVTLLVIQEIKEKGRSWEVTIAPLIMHEISRRRRGDAASREKDSWDGSPALDSLPTRESDYGIGDEIDIELDDLASDRPMQTGPRPSPNPSAPKVIVHNRDYSAWIAEFSDLFNVPFRPKRGAKEVLWGTADIDDHQIRMDFLLQQAEGTFATANRHAKAIDYCKKAGVRRLVDLPKGE